MGDNLKKVTIYSDGGCDPNPGVGGWGVVFEYNGHTRELSGGEKESTNNRMELSAAIAALSALKESCIVEMWVDSKYVMDGMKTWIHKWKKNGWKTSSGPVKNQELWKKLDEVAQKHTINWHWVAGHTGHPYNERCDVLATEAIKRIK
jgi:ribonuclease HI